MVLSNWVFFMMIGGKAAKRMTIECLACWFISSSNDLAVRVWLLSVLMRSGLGQNMLPQGGFPQLQCSCVKFWVCYGKKEAFHGVFSGFLSNW